MGIGLDLKGRYRAIAEDPETLLDRVQSWLEEHAGEPMESARLGRDSQDNPAVLVSLHPCAEDVEIAVPEPGRVSVSAKTSTVGPGYHAFLCDLLHRLGDAVAIDWDEPDDPSDLRERDGLLPRRGPAGTGGRVPPMASRGRGDRPRRTR